jgi:hypothetical protein
MGSRWIPRLGLALGARWSPSSCWPRPACAFSSRSVRCSTSARTDAGRARAGHRRRPGGYPKYGKFIQDEQLGYRPKPGGTSYGPHGAKWNDYPLEKTPGKRRLLFLGDSVTDRAKIIDALHRELGEDYEYWNAGVVGYGSQQELGYYRDYLGGIASDHVILTFHLNDYETTPITFMDGDQFIAVYGRLGTARPNAWLLKNSFLYRFYWSHSMTQSKVPRGSVMASRASEIGRISSSANLRAIICQAHCSLLSAACNLLLTDH